MSKKSKKSKKSRKNKVVTAPKRGHVILIVGRGNSGKSHSLFNLKDADKSIYANCDQKELPIQDKFGTSVYLEKPKKFLKSLKYQSKLPLKKQPKVIVLDTLTHLMREYVSLHVETSSNKMAAWAGNLDFYTNILRTIKLAYYDTILMAHLDVIRDEDGNIIGETIPISGKMGKVGIETDFTNIMHAMTIKVKTLKKYPKNKNLNITKREKMLGIKRVFLTTPITDYPYSKARSKHNLFSDNEIFIDNDIQIVLDKLRKLK